MRSNLSPQLPRRYSLVRSALTVCLSSLLIGSAGATSSFAALSIPTSQKALTLEELLDAVNNRPVKPAVEPAVEPVIDPAVVPETTEATEPEAVESAVEQAVRLRLNLSDRKVYVYRGETLEKSYPVAIGRAGWETPTGEFEVFSQVVDPGWTNPLDGSVMEPGPDNPLGERWIAFWTDGTNSIGFHGTPNRDSVGKAASHGCIRMYNEDVKELFEIVALGTPVTVEP